MDLTGAFVDAEGADIAIEALDPPALDIALPAKDLHDLVGDAAAHLGGQVLAHRDIHGDVRARVALAGGLEDQGAGGGYVDLALGQHGLHQLVGGDGRAELLAFGGVPDRLVQHADRGAGREGGEIDALLVERLHHRAEPLPRFAADQGVGGDATVGERDLADGRALLPHLGRRGAGLQPRCAAFDQEGRDAAAAPFAPVGPGKDGVEIGDGRQRDVALGAVQRPRSVIALARGGSQGRRVGAGVFLGQCKAAQDFAGRKPREVALFLLVGPVADDAFRPDAGVLGADHAIGDRALGEFEERQCQFLGGQAGPAVFLGDRPPERAEVAHGGDDLVGDAVLCLGPVLVGDRDVAHEAADAGNKVIEAGVVADHGRSLFRDDGRGAGSGQSGR